MYTSCDGGKTWTRETFISAKNYWCHSIVFHPTKPARIFAAFTAQGSRNGIWRTTDGGATWTHLKNGLPEPAEFNRPTIALAPSNPDVLYVQAANDAESVLGIFRCNDGANTWKDIAGTHFGEEEHMTYGSAIVVHPTDPDHVICGGSICIARPTAAAVGVASRVGTRSAPSRTTPTPIITLCSCRPRRRGVLRWQ